MDGTGRKRVVVTETDQSLMDRVIRGEWTVNDLIESAVNEISTAASVGSGSDRAIAAVPPVYPFKDNKLEKLFKEFEDYLHRTKKSPTKDNAIQFAERRALPESVERKLIDWIREHK
jgi:hypothetical protein